MARQHGITSNTYNEFLIDSGKLYINYGQAGEAALGATRGGTTFAINTEYRDMPVDGAKGPVKGGRRITRVEAILTVNMVEIDTTVLTKALPGSSAADYPTTPTKTHDQITRELAIATTDYLTNVAIIGEVSGSTSKYFVGILNNVIADGNLEVSLVDNDESVLAIQFKAHFDPSDMDAEPWEIRWPTIP
jgi:hypothetical protein